MPRDSREMTPIKRPFANVIAEHALFRCPHVTAASLSLQDMVHIPFRQSFADRAETHAISRGPKRLGTTMMRIAELPRAHWSRREDRQSIIEPPVAFFTATPHALIPARLTELRNGNKVGRVV